MARLPMHAGAAHKELNCVSCHAQHRFDTSYASVDACVKCHDDTHTQNYFQSKHYHLWLSEKRGIGEKGSGVSCATCHLPRIKKTQFGETYTLVDHNQNNYLQPNEKMVRSSCIRCHGLQFTLNSLADPKLVQDNFQGAPSIHVKSMEMVLEEKKKSDSKPQE